MATLLLFSIFWRLGNLKLLLASDEGLPLAVACIFPLPIERLSIVFVFLLHFTFL